MSSRQCRAEQPSLRAAVVRFTLCGSIRSSPSTLAERCEKHQTEVVGKSRRLLTAQGLRRRGAYAWRALRTTSCVQPKVLATD